MLFELSPKPRGRSAVEEVLTLGARRIPLALNRNVRARRYILRLGRNGQASVTIPRWGSAAEARRFAERNSAWLERQLERLASLPERPKEWFLGTELLLRGELVRIEACVNGEKGLVRVGSQTIRVPDATADLRVAVEGYLWDLARQELPPKVLEYAGVHGLQVGRIAVRNQRSRWGSCSRHGTISLNWRLVQVPPLASNYIIVHELMHLRQMNHSALFWREVERAFPDYQLAERWLREHSSLLK